MGSGAAGLAERDVEGNCILESFRECGVGTIYLHIGKSGGKRHTLLFL